MKWRIKKDVSGRYWVEGSWMWFLFGFVTHVVGKHGERCDTVPIVAYEYPYSWSHRSLDEAKEALTKWVNWKDPRDTDEIIYVDVKRAPK